MDAILLYPKTKEDFEAIEKFAKERNMGSSFLEEDELEFLQRKQLAEAAENWYPKEDITMDEIVSQVKETRSEIHAKKNLYNH